MIYTTAQLKSLIQPVLYNLTDDKKKLTMATNYMLELCSQYRKAIEAEQKDR